MKKGYKENIEKLTVTNIDFRRVLYTGEGLQLVLMSLKPEEEIGTETHKDSDQFFRCESGTGKVNINDSEYDFAKGDAFIVPMGAKHNVINTSQTEDLKVYTIYAKPAHKDGIVRATKIQAEVEKEEFDGKITESD